jgi:peptidylprolyl isomerase
MKKVISMNSNQTTGLLLGILILSGAFSTGCITGNPATPSPQNTSGQQPPVGAIMGDIVSVYYTGMVENGTVFNSNVNGTPLTFVLGNASVIEGFRDAVIGMRVNEEKTVTIPYDNAYGPYNSSLVRVVPRMGALENKTFIIGQTYTIRRTTDNAVSMVKILNVTRDTITWDENNPLAGQNLTYRIKLVSIAKNDQN